MNQRNWDVFNVGHATQWAFADVLVVKLKVDPETIGHENSLDKWLVHHFAKVPPEEILTENLKDIVPRMDFTYTKHH